MKINENEVEHAYTGGVEILAKHLYCHPEIGVVLDSQCGAQSTGCAYDTPERSMQNAPVWLQALLIANEQHPFLDTALASDGWWWRVF